MISRRFVIFGGAVAVVGGCSQSERRRTTTTASARMQGIAARLRPETPWRVKMIDGADPVAEVTGEGVLVVTKGLALAAQDEAAVAGALAYAIVLDAVARGGPISSDLVGIVSKALALPGLDEDMVRRLDGLPGGESGDPLRTAMSIAANAGYDPAGWLDFEADRPLRPGESEVSRTERVARLGELASSVQREFPGATLRNRRVWQVAKRGLVG